jgi:hypothetical protein
LRAFGGHHAKQLPREGLSLTPEPAPFHYVDLTFLFFNNLHWSTLPETIPELKRVWPNRDFQAWFSCRTLHTSSRDHVFGAAFQQRC